MLEKTAAAEVVGLIEEIQLRLDSISKIFSESGEEEDLASHITTAEFVAGYLHQDVVHPILEDYPELAPKNWARSGIGQWVRESPGAE
jgi:hypothetical protein